MLYLSVSIVKDGTNTTARPAISVWYACRDADSGDSDPGRSMDCSSMPSHGLRPTYMTAPRISAARFGFQRRWKVNSRCGTTMSIGSPAFQRRFTVASLPGAAFSVLPLTARAPSAHADAQHHRKTAVARLSHGQVHGVRRRIVVLNDRDRAPARFQKFPREQTN